MRENYDVCETDFSFLLSICLSWSFLSTRFSNEKPDAGHIQCSKRPHWALCLTLSTPDLKCGRNTIEIYWTAVLYNERQSVALSVELNLYVLISCYSDSAFGFSVISSCVRCNNIATNRTIAYTPV